MPMRIFQGESSARNFTEGGDDFQQEWDCPEEILREGVYFKWEELSMEEIPVRRGSFFMEGEPYLPALFEKRSEIK